MNKPQLVYYVDDDSDDLMLFEHAAETLSIPVKLFNDGQTLLDDIENQAVSPSIVFVDLNMPAVDGFDIIDFIKNREDLKDIPVVVLSTSRSETNIKKCKDLNADYYIPKPTSLAKLTEALKFVSEIDWNIHDPQLVEFCHPE